VCSRILSDQFSVQPTRLLNVCCLPRTYTFRSAACTAHIIDKLKLPPTPAAKGGFPLVCTNGARGLRVLHKAYSTIEVCSTCDEKKVAKDESSTVSNPFLNETLIIDAELFHTPLDMTLTKKTLGLAYRLGCVTNYYQNHHIYAVVRNDNHLKFTQRYAKLTGSSELYRYLNPSDQYQENESLYTEENYFGYQEAVNNGPPSKLLIVCDTERIDEITKIVNKELNGDQANGTAANVIRGSPPFFVEILSPNVHKGHGLKQLCQEIGVPLDEVIAFGDGDNDIEFLELAGKGIAMKNARDTLKAVADEVTEWTNDEVS
jgi:Cof subfamily protein (haloacid dehalogenase superfamily)